MNEIANHNNLGSFDEIEYVIQRITEEGTKQSDLEKHCLNNKDFFRIPTSGVISLLVGITFINRQEESLYLQESGKKFLNSTNRNECLIIAIVELLANADSSDFILGEKVRYDTYLNKYKIDRNSIPLKYSGIRNLLLKLGYFHEDSINKSILLIDDEFFKLTHEPISKSLKKKTIEDLKRDLDRKAEYGLIAEEFVVAYEQRRITNKVDSIKRISDIDTTAGFDILSYNQDSSMEYDRYIEVKSYTSKPAFFITRNEFKAAKRFRGKYYLYLVDRLKINMPDYDPMIISDPYDSLLSKPSGWKKSCVQCHFIKDDF
ncbi:DUF3883 domain-containing protein [Methanolobus sp. ZRKC3]|uniref:DUF3883 domain-containing protein n=1 Tax=Methanolobus sp. ZRKC3 TaxID=3125786 RepID=UPI003253DB49